MISSSISRVSAALLACALLAACQTTTEEDALAELMGGPDFSQGVDPLAESVDGLIVGHRFMASGEYELALKAYNRAASEQGLNVDVLSAIGSANMHLGRMNQAEQMLRLAIKKDETFVPAWNNLGVVLSSLGRYGEAARTFQVAFALDSGNSAEIHTNLRRALEKVENPGYDLDAQEEYDLVRRGNGRYLLLATPST